jgi:hypothetical protein
MLIKAKNQWNWFCQINNQMKSFLIFLYDKQNTDNDNEIHHDLEQFGFYRRGLPFPITDEEFQWFNQKPELIENIARIALEDFSQKRLCFRKFKVRLQVFLFLPFRKLIYFRRKLNLGLYHQLF